MKSNPIQDGDPSTSLQDSCKSAVPTPDKSENDFSAEQLKHIISVPEYQARRASFFPSESSLRWFIRKHQQRLAEAEALLMLRGAWHVHRPRMDDAVISISIEEARAAKGSAASNGGAAAS